MTSVPQAKQYTCKFKSLIGMTASDFADYLKFNPVLAKTNEDCSDKSGHSIEFNVDNSNCRVTKPTPMYVKSDPEVA